MTCEACGREVSIAARVATEALATLPSASQATIAILFGERLPSALCAACFLPTYAHALDAASV
jgi:hypothetical protein